MITSLFGRRTRPILLAGALVSIVLGAGLGVREAIRTRAMQRETAERTIKGYAQFAAYLYTTRAYLFARDRALFEAYRPIHPSDPWRPQNLPPVTALAAIPDTTERCDPPNKFPLYRFKLDMATRALTFAGTPPNPHITRIIRDSLPKIADDSWLRRAGFGYMFVDGPVGREAIAFGVVMDTTEKVLAFYGYRSCYGVHDTMDYQLMYNVVKVLPPAMTMGRDKKMLPTDSLLSLTIKDADGRTLFRAPKDWIKSTAYGQETMPMLGNTSYHVEIRPEVAKMLVIGGIPDSVPASVVLLLGSIMLAIAGFATLRTELGLFRSRERFLANVSHELRTPLQQILTFVQLLRLGRARTEQERQRSLEIIETETHRLIALSDTVMSAAAPRRVLGDTAFQVESVVRNSAAFFQPLAHAKKVCIELDVEPAKARGDAQALRQILVNVLDNAVKYGPVGQTITIGLRNDPDLVRLWVDDHGPGIPLEDRDRVFKPFLRLHRKVEQSTGGAGLGLSIVHDLANQMNAEVDITDAPTGGARFRLSLQRATEGEGEAA